MTSNLIRFSTRNAMRDLRSVYPDLSEEPIHAVPGGRLLWKNLTAIVFDFFGQKFEDLSQDRQEVLKNELDRFFLKECAILSDRQRHASEVNSQIETGLGDSAWRPPRYGRALVVERTGSPRLKAIAGKFFGQTQLPKPVLIDIKGCGVAPDAMPSPKIHRTGLLPLWEAIEEVTKQAIVDQALIRTLPEVTTLPIYAVLQLPFNEFREGKGASPATLILRRPHTRNPDNNEIPRFQSEEYFFKLEVEFALRRCGVTSCAGPHFRIHGDSDALFVRHGTTDLSDTPNEIKQNFLQFFDISPPFKADIINIQSTSDVSLSPVRGDLLDFGQYEVRSNFSVPLMALAREFSFGCGGLLRPNTGPWVQPELDLAFSGTLFDRERGLVRSYTCPNTGKCYGPMTKFKAAALNGSEELSRVRNDDSTFETLVRKLLCRHCRLIAI